MNNFRRLPSRLLVLVSLPLLAVRCREEEPPPKTPLEQLPPATTTGADTFGCLVNGEPWVFPRPKYRHPPSLQADWSYAQAVIVSMRFEDARGYFGISMAVEDSLATGRILRFSSDSIGLPNTARIDFPNRIYRPRHLVDGSIKFTRLDRQAQIVSGTFAFTMAQAGDTVRVTDGRFDIPDVAL